MKILNKIFCSALLCLGITFIPFAGCAKYESDNLTDNEIQSADADGKPSSDGGGNSETQPTGVIPAPPKPDETQEILLWEEGKIPCYNERYQQMSRDDDGFIPYMVSYPAKGDVKGAVMICAGGGFEYRSMRDEGYDVARYLCNLGYRCFVVAYRLKPYSQSVAALDLARAVRYVRYYAEDYGIDKDDIAALGFSAGGILCGELALYNDGARLPDALDNGYLPDALDYVSAKISAIGHLYSYYGRLAEPNNNVETLKRANLPPSFYAFGTLDSLYDKIVSNIAAVQSAGVSVEKHIFEGADHAFGAGVNKGVNWIPLFNEFLIKIFSVNNAK